MKKNHLVIGLIIALLTSYYTFHNLTWREISESLFSMRLLPLIAGILLISLSFLLRAMRWHLLVATLGNVKTVRLLSPLMIGFMGNLLPARAGEFIRAYLLSKREKLAFSSCLATIVLERLLDIFFLLLITSSLLIFKSDLLSSVKASDGTDYINLVKATGWSMLLLCFAGFLAVCLVHYRTLWFLRVVEVLTSPFPSRFRSATIHFTRSFSEGLGSLGMWKNFGGAFLLTLLVWAAMVATNYPFLVSFGVDSLPLVSLPVLTVTTSIFIIALPTPGFIGSFQAGVLVALHGIFSVPEPVAASIGIVSWVVSIAFVIFSGAYFIVADNIAFSSLTAPPTNGRTTGPAVDSLDGGKTVKRET
jgi:uncharacterized protein (TIRG00374 family)